MAVIEKYAKDNGYSMILDVSNPNTPVLYASSGIDITQDIVSLYDKTSTGGAPAPTGRHDAHTGYSGSTHNHGPGDAHNTAPDGRD